ncbi:signal peptidase II [candidate division KSB1 bacterium]|nr:signal peptidase II [candidate division KSB1 bacterium]
MKKIIIIVLAIIVLVSLDLITKNWAVNNLKTTYGFDVIEGFWRFDYVENHNIAFGIGTQLPESYKQPIILSTNILALVFLLFFMRQAPKSVLLYISATVIISGALGNLIDRIHNGFVVDFIHWYYQSFHWPVFNLADTYVTIGMVLLFIEFLFFNTSKKVDPAASNT